MNAPTSQGKHMAEGEGDGRGRSSMNAVFDRMNTVEKQIAALTTNVGHLSTQLTRVATSLEERSSTDWKALASWATVVLAIVGIFLSQVIAPVKQVGETNAANIARINDARLADSHDAVARAEERGRDRERIDQQRRELEKAWAVIEQIQRKGISP